MSFAKMTRCITALQAYDGKAVKVNQVIEMIGMGVTEIVSETTFSMQLDYVDFNVNRGLLRVHDSKNIAQFEFRSMMLEEIAKVGKTLVFTEKLGHSLQRKTIVYLMPQASIKAYPIYAPSSL